MWGSWSWDLLLGIAAGLLLAWVALIVALVIARPRGGLLREALRLLPDVLRLLPRLADRVRRQGGSCRLLQVGIADQAERAQVVAEMNAARDQEYGEVLERLPEFLAELDKERARGRTTYAEVEECEADLERYRSWLAKIAARDYFGAGCGEAARAAVAAAAAELAAFEQAALVAEAPPEHAPPTGGPRSPAAGGP